MSAFELIDDVELGSAAASITVTGIDTDYRRFRLTFFGIKDGSAGRLQIRFNGDTGSNYARQVLHATGASVAGARATTTSIDLNASHSNIEPNTAVTLTVEVEKPAAGVPARVTAKYAYMIEASGVAHLSASAEWNNTANLIDEIIVLASATNFATGTRLVIEGAKL